MPEHSDCTYNHEHITNERLFHGRQWSNYNIVHLHSAFALIGVVVVNPGSGTTECSTHPVVITASSGTITSPGYDEGQYPNDAFCQWHIMAPAGEVRCRFIQPTDVF